MHHHTVAQEETTEETLCEATASAVRDGLGFDPNVFDPPTSQSFIVRYACYLYAGYITVT